MLKSGLPADQCNALISPCQLQNTERPSLHVTITSFRVKYVIQPAFVKQKGRNKAFLTTLQCILTIIRFSQPVKKILDFKDNF
ncbi:hypothetical protein FKM82_024721 [Ascaphus truei]